ncbi:endonuclease-reverse transcriptase [Elysia marginata]|uniref:Endonuclease-reverse transcriptase n=1 Tax=Elysia marginata TaxID=1093978 RepID=A0AAV4IQX5_9GAST|nr:endonuclease-reverse transcriptase [Elysia marginata]
MSHYGKELDRFQQETMEMDWPHSKKAMWQHHKECVGLEQIKRSRGRPRGTWRRVRDNDVKDSGHTWNHVKRVSQDRERWRGFVDGPYPAPG